MQFRLRPFEPADADACLALFRECVHRVNICDYTPEQVDAWAPADLDSDAWASRFTDRFAYVAVEGCQVVGFTDMTHEGHLDRLFVSADHQRQGIARHLVETLVRDANQHNIREITVEASITAKLFFERMGFKSVREQTVQCRGVKMTNHQMQRDMLQGNQ